MKCQGRLSAMLAAATLNIYLKIASMIMELTCVMSFKICAVKWQGNLVKLHERRQSDDDNDDDGNGCHIETRNRN
jgi:hypothetical protein